MRVWQLVPLPIQGKIFVALPLLAVAVSAVLAGVGNYQRYKIQSAVQRHFQMASGVNEVLALMVNAETGLRGYLLTRREEFLQPYVAASENLPAAFERLRTLAEAEPGDEPRTRKLQQLEQIRALLDLQMADLTWQRSYIAAPNASDAEIYNHLAYGKELMDKIRANFHTMEAEEETLLAERLEEINAIRRRDYFGVFIALFFGVGTRLLAWYLFNSGITRRIEQLVENTRSLRRGASLQFPPTDKNDALGDLEREIVLLDKQLNENNPTLINSALDGTARAEMKMR